MRSPRPPPAELAPSRGLSRGTLALLLALLGLLAAAMSLSWYVWRELDDVAIGAHGRIALALGSGAAVALGGGLMWLVYYSNRCGYDD
jgi:hypothetical protein